LDEKIERIIDEWSMRGNFEVTGRHSLADFIRLVEINRTIDGDIGIIKLADGRVQAIESDRIRTPNDIDSDPEWTHGVNTDAAGAAISYAVHSRRRYGNYTMERVIPAEHMILHGYYSRFDQIRGVGLLVSAANAFADIHESFNYALAKVKMMQLFGLSFSYDENSDPTPTSQRGDMDKKNEERRMALRDKASYIVELGPGEKVNEIESKQPSSEFQEYTKLMMMVALKSLNIAYCLFDEDHTNFYGSRAAVNFYIESCKPKRESNQHLLSHLTRWKLAHEILAGRLVLPDGMTVHDLWFEWAPSGIPWWKPDEEVKGNLMAVTSGFESPSGVCRARGMDFKDIIDERVRDEEYAKSKGITLAWMATEDNLSVNIGS
jgi:capsid protein